MAPCEAHTNENRPPEKRNKDRVTGQREAFYYCALTVRHQYETPTCRGSTAARLSTPEPRKYVVKRGGGDSEEKREKRQNVRPYNATDPRLRRFSIPATRHAEEANTGCCLTNLKTNSLLEVKHFSNLRQVVR